MNNRTYKNTMAILAVTLAVAACGGGGSSDKSKAAGQTNTPTGPTAPTKPTGPAPGDVVGFVFDGPVQSATVWCDVNKNEVLDQDEVKTLSDSKGRFNIACPAGNYLVVQGDGTAQDTLAKADMRGVLKGYVQESTKGFTQLNSLITLAVEMIHAGASPSDAEGRIKNAFGIPAEVSIFGSHPAANAPLVNAILAMQTGLLSATGELAFVDRAASASDNPSINAIHSTLNKKLASRLFANNGPLDQAGKIAMLQAAISDATPDLVNHPNVDPQVKRRLGSFAGRLNAMASIAAKIALDRHEQQFNITAKMLENLDLTGGIPSTLAPRIAAAATWSSRFGDPVNLHLDTSRILTESEYVKSIAGYLQLNDGSYMDPRFREDGTFAFAVDIDQEEGDVEYQRVIRFNPSGDHLNSGLQGPLYYDPFTPPGPGFTLYILKEFSSPDELLNTNILFGNIYGDLKTGLAAVKIPEDNVEYGYYRDTPTVAFGVRLTVPEKFAPKNGMKYFVVYHDREPLDKHSIVMVNNGLTGKGVRGFVTPIRVWCPRTNPAYPTCKS